MLKHFAESSSSSSNSCLSKNNYCSVFQEAVGSITIIKPAILNLFRIVLADFNEFYFQYMKEFKAVKGVFSSSCKLNYCYCYSK